MDAPVVGEPGVMCFQEREGKPGGGKGLLNQGDRTGALSTLTNQCIALDQGAGKSSVNTTVEHSPTLATTHQGEPAIALDGDKLKPREDQRKGGNGFGINEEGAGYTLTGVDRHGVAYETECYENHAQDSRIKSIDVSDTRNQKDGTGGNNLPIVCFSKVSHPHAPNGEGERWDEREVAQTRNTFDNGEKRCQEVVVSMAQNTRDEVRIIGVDGQIAGALPAEPGMKQQTYVVSTAFKLDSTASNSMKSKNPHSGFHETQVAACLDTTPPDPSKNQGGNVIVSTNSNGEDIAPTISSCEYKMGQKQKDTSGGYVVTRQEGAEGEVL